ncbi:hypothetical protein BDP27DRAFT_1414866 [Rhodocollybia butyracea]|uniref:C2H2-type domain-containing protein n=1 Tax=Rhodocollybia butyracea TaxID=206335 RepID=A0A9P5Q6H6_9AGAR|nr:hypothetical protein BDP27DRAFT_1414866 [Rhodocollybia butyracea]
MPSYSGVGNGAADQDDVLPKERIHPYQPLFIGITQTVRQFKAEYDALITQRIGPTGFNANSRNAHASLCQEWFQLKRMIEMNTIRKQREEAIVIRLGEIGWREEIKILMDEWPGMFVLHEAVNQTKKLTEHDWNSIKDELVQLLAKRKTSRVDRPLCAKLQERYGRLSQEYTKILARSDLRIPFPTPGDILTNKLSEHLPSILSEWRPAKVKELVEIIQKARPKGTAADLDLLTTLFGCTDCDSAMHFPQMFYHNCCATNKASGASHERLLSLDDDYYNSPQGPWMSHKLVLLNEALVERVKDIARACSLDVEASTIEDLHSADPLIECVNCSSPNERFFMRWPQAFVCCSYCHRDMSAFVGLRSHLIVVHADHVVEVDQLPTLNDDDDDDRYLNVRLFDRKDW